MRPAKQSSEVVVFLCFPMNGTPNPVLSVAKVEESSVSAGVKESFLSRVPSRTE